VLNKVYIFKNPLLSLIGYFFKIYKIVPNTNFITRRVQEKQIKWYLKSAKQINRKIHVKRQIFQLKTGKINTALDVLTAN